MMRSSVKAAWPAFIAQFEGRLPFLYLDTLSLVTFGVGQLGESANKPTDFLLSRPWRDPNGRLVTEAWIRSQFDAVNERVDLAPKGGRAFESISSIRLRDPDIDEALLQTTGDFWAVLVRTLPKLEEWPADAQLAMLNMAWHLGPNFLGSLWPSFTAAAKAGDFLGCVAHCQTARRTERDATNVRLYQNAARVGFARLDPEILWQTTTVMLPIGRVAALSVSASKAKWAFDNPALVGVNGWYVQVMLAALALYTGPLDGKCGPVTASGLRTFTVAHDLTYGVTVPVLTALSAATTRVPIVA